MTKAMLRDLTQGIRLENSDTLLPWRTEFGSLRYYGKPEIRRQSGRQMVVWKNESILGGIRVDLNVMCEPDDQCRRKKLKNVSAYISESDFEKARTDLDNRLGRKGKYTRLNNVEFAYSWKIRNCVVTLSHLDRFGSFWRLDVQRGFSFRDVFMPSCMLPGFRAMLRRTRELQQVTLFRRSPSLQPVALFNV